MFSQATKTVEGELAFLERMQITDKTTLERGLKNAQKKLRVLEQIYISGGLGYSQEFKDAAIVEADNVRVTADAINRMLRDV